LTNTKTAGAAVRNILVAVDGSQSSQRAVEFAASLAAATDASLALLHVLSPEEHSLAGASALSQEDLSKRTQQAAAPILDAARNIAGEHLVVTTDVRRGHPADEIVAYAAQITADLIVMGSRGLSDLQSLLLGSVSSSVVQHAPCSVTIVR